MQKWEEICIEREDAKKEGYRLAQTENAKKMLADNMPVETIAKYTGLSIETVLKEKQKSVGKEIEPSY